MNIVQNPFPTTEDSHVSSPRHFRSTAISAKLHVASFLFVAPGTAVVFVPRGVFPIEDLGRPLPLRRVHCLRIHQILFATVSIVVIPGIGSWRILQLRSTSATMPQGLTMFVRFKIEREEGSWSYWTGNFEDEEMRSSSGFSTCLDDTSVISQVRNLCIRIELVTQWRIETLRALRKHFEISTDVIWNSS